MEKTTKKYVEYLYPGLIVSETSRSEIEHNDPEKVEIKEHCVGFRFIEQDFVIDGKEQYDGKTRVTSNCFLLVKDLHLMK